MSLRRITAYVAVFVSLSGTVGAQEVATVQSLVKQGFAIVGTFAARAAEAGVFLQKNDQVFLCFVAETQRSQAAATSYCKPVR
jgi:hypothetical protein